VLLALRGSLIRERRGGRRAQIAWRLAERAQCLAQSADVAIALHDVRFRGKAKAAVIIFVIAYSPSQSLTKTKQNTALARWV